MSSPPLFSGVRFTRSLVLYVCFLDRICPFVLFLFAIVLSVLLWYTDSDYRFKFGIFKLYLLWFKFLFISEWLFCLPLKLYWCSIYITDNQIALQIYANKCSRKIKCMVIALTVNPFTAFDDSDYHLWYPQTYCCRTNKDMSDDYYWRHGSMIFIISDLTLFNLKNNGLS
jgi:hypothetical protein